MRALEMLPPQAEQDDGVDELDICHRSTSGSAAVAKPIGSKARKRAPKLDRKSAAVLKKSAESHRVGSRDNTIAIVPKPARPTAISARISNDPTSAPNRSQTSSKPAQEKLSTVMTASTTKMNNIGPFRTSQ